MHIQKITRLLIEAEYLLELSIKLEHDEKHSKLKQATSFLVSESLESLRALDLDWGGLRALDLKLRKADFNAAKGGWDRFLDGKVADKSAAVRKQKNELVDSVKQAWNALSPYHGFALVNKVTTARRARILSVAKTYPRIEDWRTAIERYMKDAERWPDRKNFGIDTFLRPTKFEQWFDNPNPITKNPKDMTQEEADRWYGQGL